MYKTKAFIATELDKKRIPYGFIKQYTFKMRCPFHPTLDRNPSLQVTITKPWSVVYKCWSCGAGGGGWNNIAEKAGLTKLTTNQKATTIDAVKYNVNQINKQDEITIGKDLVCYPFNDQWREIPYAFLQQFNPRIWYDQTSAAWRLILDVNIYDELQGYIGAALYEGTKPKYRNLKGLAAKEVFFPLNTLLHDTAVLVEGPYDAIRLQYFGYPAMAILGTDNWSTIKVSLLASAGIEKIILLMDGDDAGYKAVRDIWPTINKGFNVKVLYLYDGFDPGNMGPEYFEQLNNILKGA